MSQNQFDSQSDTGIDAGTAGRRVRGLSREITVALVVTAAAIASIVGAANHASQQLSVASDGAALEVPKATRSQ